MAVGGMVRSSYLHQPLILPYELTSTGTCTEAVRSGGPSETGSSIPDGTCARVSFEVDYITLTGWLNDSGTKWATGKRSCVFRVVMTGTATFHIRAYEPGMR